MFQSLFSYESASPKPNKKLSNLSLSLSLSLSMINGPKSKISKRLGQEMGAQKNNPKPCLKKKPSTTLQTLFDLDSKITHSSNANTKRVASSSSPSSSVPQENQEILSLISICNHIYTFTDPSESPSQQDNKRLKLIQLLSFIKTSKKPLNDQILPQLFSMLQSNLFRPLPPPSNTTLTFNLFEDEDLSANPSPSWPHLQILYDILLRLIINLDPQVLKLYIDHSFINSLLTNFQSEDPRERESLKNVYHRVYSKCTFHRAFMRKTTTDVFLQYISECDNRHCGIGELLEICGSIINGFSVPLKEEHRMFLTKVLIPLHKPKGMQVYHRQLAYCVSQFVQKGPEMSEVVVRGILRYWPVTNCRKEVLFIGELEELVEVIDPEQYSKLALPLCIRITKCLNSWNSQVAERALYIWNNEEFVKMASQEMEEVFPVVVEGMERNLKRHWSKSVKQLTENVKAMMEEMQPTLYRYCFTRLDFEESATCQEAIKRKEKWERVEMAAARNQFFLPKSLSMCS